MEVVKNLTQSLQAGAKILELGCGFGFPIASMLYKLGFDLYAIDSSMKMVERFRNDLPDIPIQCSKVLNSTFFDTQFDAIIAYGLIIHLPQNEQVQLITKVSRHLGSKGVFLFNSGDEDGERMTPPGLNGGESFMTYSMSSNNYKKVLSSNKLILQNHYIEKGCGGTIYIAQKEN